MTILSNAHPVIHFAWTLALALSALVGALAGSLFLRRAVRFGLARHRRSTRARIQPLIDGLCDNCIDSEAGFDKLRKYPEAVRQMLLDRLALGDEDADPVRLARLRSICADFGLVDLWRRQLTRPPSGWSIPALLSRKLTSLERIPSLSFVVRAEAADNLGRIRDQTSCRLLGNALEDPHLAVRSAAAQALSRIRAPSSFPVLVRKLEDAALGRGATLSVRTLRMTLSAFPLACTSGFADMLQHPHRRARFLAADVIATMMERNSVAAQSRIPLFPLKISLREAGNLNQINKALPKGKTAESGFPPPHDALPGRVAEIFLTRLPRDPNPDVRARASDVIAHLDDPRAAPALVALLNDGEWFVRLHAARALSRYRPCPIEALGRRLTDSNWRVREAATKAIATQGRRGVSFLLAHYRATTDRYSREQVGEQIQRAGFDLGVGGATVST